MWIELHLSALSASFFAFARSFRFSEADNFLLPFMAGRAELTGCEADGTSTTACKRTPLA